MIDVFNESLIFLIGKGIVLVLLLLYLIFSFIMYTHARSLGAVLTITHSNISRLLNLLFLLHLLLGLSLFFIALAIL